MRVLFWNAGADAEPTGAVNGHEAAIFPRGYQAGHGPASALNAVRAEAKQVLLRAWQVHGAKKAPVRRENEAGQSLLARAVAQNGELLGLSGGRERPKAAFAHERGAAVLILPDIGVGANEAQTAVRELHDAAYGYALGQLELLADIARLGRGGGGDLLRPGPGQFADRRRLRPAGGQQEKGQAQRENADAFPHFCRSFLFFLQLTTGLYQSCIKLASQL